MAVYVLIATVPWNASDGTTQPIGTVMNRILWDGVTPYTPPQGFTAVPDNGHPIYNPQGPVVLQPGTITLGSTIVAGGSLAAV